MIPFPWLGSKVGMLDIILPNIPPHEHYVEPFAGAATVFLAKPLARLNTINDRDENIVSFFRVLQEPRKTQALLRRLKYTPYSRSEYRKACMLLSSGRQLDDVVRAWAFYVAQSMSVSHSYYYDPRGRSFGQSRQPTTIVYSSYLGRIRRLLEIASKMRMAQIENIDGVRLMERVDSPDVFMFVDPPYISRTVRLKASIYSADYDDTLHERLMDFLLVAKSKIMLASYPCEFYDSLLNKGWVRIDKDKVISAVRVSPEPSSPRRPRRTESIYLNYKPPQSYLLL
jgi:DNA adenine methylase